VGGQPGDGGPPPLLNILPLLAVGVILYVLLVRPEQRRRKAHDQLVAGLKRNDQIVTTGGIHGRVVGVADKVLTVEIAPKVQVVVDRAAVQTIQAAGEPREKEREKS
jgi:preprotein translocase subunit YajC